MVMTVELSLYPFRENYRELIKDFIRKLAEYDGLRVVPGPTSTVMIGEQARAMEVLGELIQWSYAEHGKQVLVAKFIPDFDPGSSELA